MLQMKSIGWKIWWPEVNWTHSKVTKMLKTHTFFSFFVCAAVAVMKRFHDFFSCCGYEAISRFFSSVFFKKNFSIFSWNCWLLHKYNQLILLNRKRKLIYVGNLKLQKKLLNPVKDTKIPWYSHLTIFLQFQAAQNPKEPSLWAVFAYHSNQNSSKCF